MYASGSGRRHVTYASSVKPPEILLFSRTLCALLRRDLLAIAKFLVFTKYKDRMTWYSSGTAV